MKNVPAGRSSWVAKWDEAPLAWGNAKSDGGKAYGLGIVTHNDEFFVGWSESEVRVRVQMMASETISDDETRASLPVEDSPYRNTARERGKVRKSDWANKIWKLYYRPFDWRYIYYEPDLMEIGRGGASRGVMPRIGQNNRVLMVSRGFEIEQFEHVLVANTVTVHHAATRKEGNYTFPLYLYSDPAKPGLWGAEEAPSSGPGGRRANLAPEFVAAMAGRLGLRWVADGRGDRVATFGPEDVFSYIYAIFHAPGYRARYADFLKSDFPRVPLTSNVALFRALCGLGDRMVALHLLEAEGDPAGRPSFPVPGDNRMEQARYVEPDGEHGRRGQVYINATQYFEGVEPEVWEFHIGGYQVAEKWLKDRKGRTLSYDDIEHYQKTIAALTETAARMERVDEVIEEAGGWPLG
ncbi:MAG TPA: type ISP restriction/modification enzyme [Ktedonobacterales bacterium]|nr:type ISP restriction/modification enzyme [Ktedonobacterales bacterium]